MVDLKTFFLYEAVYTILAMETNLKESEFDIIFFSKEFAEVVAALCVKYYFLFASDELPF